MKEFTETQTATRKWVFDKVGRRFGEPYYRASCEEKIFADVLYYPTPNQLQFCGKNPVASVEVVEAFLAYAREELRKAA